MPKLGAIAGLGAIGAIEALLPFSKGGREGFTSTYEK